MSSAPSGNAVAAYGRKNPFLARILKRRSLSRAGSAKDTQHLEIELAGSGLEYSVGDSLGVFGRNPLALVDDLLAALRMDGEQPAGPGASQSLRTALERSYTINRASRKILQSLLDRLSPGESRSRVEGLLAAEMSSAEYLYPRDYVDILREFPEVRYESPEAFLKVLSPIQPRLYSIASSPVAHPGEVHLCVAVVRYETFGRSKTGLASGFLGSVAQVGVPDVPVFVQESPKFFLPSDGNRDIIMVGPGTGIAPFRAFIEQRAADGARGRNWLFFGDQHRASDYLYEEEFERFQREGILHRIDLAFSRDQAQKIYVQHRMLEQSAELWRWLQGGAYFYVCGDARRMAKDVHQVLIQIAQREGGMTPEAAVSYVEETLAKTERRYLKDVY